MLRGVGVSCGCSEGPGGTGNFFFFLGGGEGKEGVRELLVSAPPLLLPLALVGKATDQHPLPAARFVEFRSPSSRSGSHVQLRVEELMSYHVCYDQDRVVRALVFWIGEVCRNCASWVLASICICEGKGEGRVGG